jgi:hypothetical protein
MVRESIQYYDHQKKYLNARKAIRLPRPKTVEEFLEALNKDGVREKYSDFYLECVRAGDSTSFIFGSKTILGQLKNKPAYIKADGTFGTPTPFQQVFIIHCKYRMHVRNEYII